MGMSLNCSLERIFVKGADADSLRISVEPGADNE